MPAPPKGTVPSGTIVAHDPLTVYQPPKSVIEMMCDEARQPFRFVAWTAAISLCIIIVFIVIAIAILMWQFIAFGAI